jgi:hypothetical protein
MLRVDAVEKVAGMRSRLPRRARISVCNKGDGRVDHTIHDMLTGEKRTLPAKEAWELYNKLNIEV